MELSALTAMEPLLPGLGGGGGVGSGLFPDLLTLDGAGSGRSHHHHHLVKRTVWPGADSEMLFNSLVGPDTFPNFLAGSVTINAHRVVAHLTAISLFNWIFPATTGEIRATLEEITIFTDPQVQGFNIYVNVANMIYQIIGRFVVDVVLFGPQRTFEGIRSKSLREIVDFVFSNTTSTNNLHRFIFEGFGMTLGWAGVRVISAVRSGAVVVTRAKRSDEDDDNDNDDNDDDGDNSFDFIGQFNQALARIVHDMEVTGTEVVVDVKEKEKKTLACDK